MSSALVDQIQLAAAEMLTPPPEMTVAEWADRYRRLSSESAAEKGEWRTARAPYQRAVMDAMSPSSPYEFVVLMWAAQMGKTSLLENFIGYIIDLDPGPILLVEPREADAEAFSKDRLAPMLRDTPRLQGKVSEPKGRSAANTVLHKRFMGGSITLASASSPAALAMRSVRYVLLDEVDRYPASAGAEGDPVSLAITRAANFWNRKIVLCSTPTVAGASRIEQEWLRSNQQQYWVPCPHCHEHQVLHWQGLVWRQGRPETAVYHCQHCGRAISEHHKTWMLMEGAWRPQQPEVQQSAGYWISALYSPWRRWRELALKWERAQSSIELLREFINTVLAEPWDDAAQTSVEIATLLERREYYPAQVPLGAAVLTAGVDVQKDRLEIEVVGWGRGEESWSIDYRVIAGDPSGSKLWQELDAYLNQEWQHESGAKLRLAAACIDAGYQAQAVYEFCRTRYHRHIYPVKGAAGSIPVWPRRPTARQARGERPWPVGVDAAKEVIIGRLRNAAPGTPGYCHFPHDRQREWFEQLLGEVLVTSYVRGQPKREWRPKPNCRHEALDCRVYAYAALRALISLGLSLDNECDRFQPRPPSPVEPPPARYSGWLPPLKGWLQR